MVIPERLEHWNYDKVVQLVMEDEAEPYLYDFKEALNFDRKALSERLKSRIGMNDKDRQSALDKAQQDHSESILRTACGMANTDGGFIIFGVSDRAKVSSPQDRLVGIPLAGEERMEFGQKIKVIQRPVSFDARALEFKHEQKKGFFIVHVPLSPLRPHMVDHIFYLRGPGGHAIQMGFYEVRDQMLYTEERLRKVSLLRLEIEHYLAQVNEIRRTPSSAATINIPVYFDTTAFKPLVADISVLLPPGDEVLHQLLKIPVYAHLVQKALDTHNRGLVDTLIPNLEVYCKNSEMFLAKRFDPRESTS